jgi:hypothetical protein
MKLFSAYAAAELLERDRQTIVRALRSTPSDGRERGQPRWKMSTIVSALENNSFRDGKAGSGHEHDAQLAALYSKFDIADGTMRKLKSVAACRKAATAMAPLIAEMDALTRKVGLANRQDSELVHLRADKLFLLYLRGFEECCQWSMNECWEYLDLRE